MAERYQKLFSLQGYHYNEDCPVLVHDGAITKDNERLNIFIQLKMENFSGENKKIRAVTVIFDFYDSFGKEVVNGFQYDYLDLDCKPGDIFGSKTPVFIDDQSVRSFTFTVSKVLFSDGSEWNRKGFEWSVYHRQKKLEDAGFDSQQIRQLKNETLNRAEFAYESFDKLWLCACGKVNPAAAEKCPACQLGKAYLESVTPEYLRNNAVYAEAISNMTAEKFDEAIRLFGFIKGWRDADEKVRQCEEKIKAKHKKKKKKRIGCLTSILGTVLALILFVTVGIPAIAYGIGNSNYKNGNYETASVAFAFLGPLDYKDSAEKFVESSLYFCKDAFSADYEATIEYELDSLFNGDMNSVMGQDVINETAYNWAVEQSQAGEYFFASHIFDCLEDYKDSAERMTQCNSAMLTSAEAGKYVRFGTFEQTSLFDGKEFIDWKVLARSDNMIFVVADRALTRSVFSGDGAGEVSWADSEMRRYLNYDFISEAFTAEEQSRILSVYLEDNFDYLGESYSAPVTQDRVFLLSINELSTYLPDSEKAKCIATNEVVSGEYDANYIVNVSWALRSPEFVVDMDGKAKKAFNFYDSSMYVRPAMWITVN